jgi:ubiquinone/menaquinone biosynthesis C-methylase UbiE
MAKRVCPVWIGYLLASPIRKLLQNPKKILCHYVKEGMMVLDIGCAMGFFSLPLSKMVGSKGKVICVDVQEGMIKALKKRAVKAGLAARIETRLCDRGALGLNDLAKKIDFALASAVVHEIPDPSLFFTELYEVIKPGGKCLVVEPKGHVAEKDFDLTVSVAQKSGLNVVESPHIARSRAVLFEKLC